jgi:hypothetical protein
VEKERMQLFMIFEGGQRTEMSRGLVNTNEKDGREGSDEVPFYNFSQAFWK